MARTGWIEVALLVACVVALALLVLRDDGRSGVEIEVRDPPRGVDEIVVHVSGAVASPGLVTVPPGGRIADAVELAGGLLEGADETAINLARRARDQERLVVPRSGDAVTALVDLNRATAEELDTLPGIGTAYASRIVEAREVEAFASSDDLVLRGILPASVYEQIRDLVATP